MHAKDAIRHTLDSSDMIIGSYIKDLSDAELLVRPVEGMNHIAWQLGHLLSAERHFVEMVKPGASPALPADFEAGHGRECFGVDEASKYYTAARYRELWETQRAATRAVLEGLSDADLSRTDPSFPPYAPSVGALLNMCGVHALMHSGQFVAVRRQLGKPVAI